MINRFVVKYLRDFSNRRIDWKRMSLNLNRAKTKSAYPKAVFFTMALLLAVEFDGSLFAFSAMQESQKASSHDATGLERGPMQKIAPSVKQILKMKFDLDGKFILIDQKSWGEQETLKAQKLAIRKQMLDRKVDEAAIERMVDQVVRSRITAGPITKLFSEVRKSGGMRSSSTSVSGGRTTMTSFGADLSCRVSLSGDRFEMRIDEFKGPGRTLEVCSTVGTRILLTGTDTLAMLHQTDVGIMGVLIDGDEVFSGRASDYYALSKQNSELHGKLSAIFRHAGVDLPLGVNEPEVKRVALRMLGSMYSSDLTGLSQLIEQLNASEFSAREEASKEIEELFPAFEGAILKELDSDELSIEARNRLKIIVKRKEEAQAGDRRAEDCVKANKLLGSIDYIISLFEIADEQSRQLLVRHLTKTTQQDFGMDVEKWKQWSRDNAE
tara:strand:- start:163 stop:1479 length:1317 start_codon:yes stop_codon:yes gene_type:complete